MFVLTAKLSKPKLIAACVLVIALIALIILLAVSGAKEPSQALMGRSNDERVAYLATFGWSVNAEPVEAQSVKIPEGEDNEVFARYNELQRSQGFDLSAYAGREVTRYVYEILNYPETSGSVYASILVCDGVIIGGDITDTSPEGLIHGFASPAQSAQPQESSSAATESSEAPESSASEE